MPPTEWTILKALQWTVEYFSSKGIETARLDAELLLANALGLNRVQIYTNWDRPLSTEEKETFRLLVEKRGKREPLAYIIGSKEFYSLSFFVTPDVLIPRPETELIIDLALQTKPSPKTILDIGTGSGCIAITLAKQFPDSQIWAVDLSEKALEIAKKNAEFHQVSERVKLMQWNMVSQTGIDQKFDWIISNPPYVKSSEIPKLEPELHYEPSLALDGGEEGLDYYRLLAKWSVKHLNPDGRGFFEIGFDQANEVTSIFKQIGFKNITTHWDGAKLPRVIQVQ